MQALTFFFAFVAVLALIGARRLAGSPICRQSPRRQHQSRTDAAVGGDRRRRRGRPQAAGAGATRQHRTSADDRRSDRYRRRAQYRPRHARTGTDGAAAGRSAPNRPGLRRCRTPAGPTTVQDPIKARSEIRRLRSRRTADAGAAATAGAAFFRRRIAPPGTADPARDRAIAAILWRASRRSRLAAVPNPAPSCVPNRCRRA